MNIKIQINNHIKIFHNSKISNLAGVLGVVLDKMLII